MMHVHLAIVESPYANCLLCGGTADASHLSDGAGSASTVPQSIGASTIIEQPAAGRRNVLLQAPYS